MPHPGNAGRAAAFGAVTNGYTGQPFRGEGPGAQTRDGCSVELYRRLPYAGEVELIEPWIAGPRILELGCGVGRLTKRFLERGYDVTAVDNAPEMLEFVPREATTVCSDIEHLALDAHFDAVILASNLINVPSVAQRSAFLEACHRHLRRGGALLFQHYDPAWMETAAIGPAGQLGEVHVHIDRLERYPDHVEMSLRFCCGTQVWLHHFAAIALDDGQLRAAVVEAGFEPPSWIDRCWGSAVRSDLSGPHA